MTKAVIFDMDGLLVDTETVSLGIAEELLLKHKISLSEEDKSDFIGITVENFYKNLFEKRNLSLSTSQILREHFDLYEEALRKGAKPFQNVNSLVDELSGRGFRLGLFSGSPRTQVDIILGQLKLKNKFDVTLSHDDVKVSKPRPDGFLMCSKKLGVRPEDCIVLEDAKAGVMAAKAANMKVIGVINNGNQDLSGADFVAKNLVEVESMLKNNTL